MNSGTDTPIIPKTVKKLSVIEPRYNALKVPNITPKIDDKINAATDNSKVAGSLSKSISFIATQLAKLYPKFPFNTPPNQFI